MIDENEAKRSGAKSFDSSDFENTAKTFQIA